MPFQKGQSGNPGGRPKKADTLTGILDEMGTQAPAGQKKARKVLLAERLWRMALGDGDDIAPDLAAAKYIYDRLDGRPTESVQHSGPDSGPLNITVNWGKSDD